MRTVLYEAANSILTRPVKSSTLKRWALAVAKRAGRHKAKVALARKLAVVLHRMLANGTPFVAEAAKRAPVAAAAEPRGESIPRRETAEKALGARRHAPQPRLIAGTMDQVRP